MQLISIMRMAETGPQVRMWEVPDSVELEPGPDWVEQTAPDLAGTGGGWRPPWAGR